MDELTPLFVRPGLSAWCALLLAWLIERYYPIKSAVDPIAFFRFVCDRMAAQVLPIEQQSQQHYISGTLAACVLVAPAIVIVYLTRELASYPFLIDAMILFVCLQFSQHTHSLKQINHALRGNKKQLARELLQPNVLRDTAILSELGINKASIEMYALRLAYQQAVVLFWFIIFGPVAALSYRMCYEAKQSWNVKRSKFARFGWFVHLICSVLQWVPLRLFALTLLLLSVPKQIGKRLKLTCAPVAFCSAGGRVMLSAMASAIGKNISGPVYYDHSKVSRARCNVGSEPTLSDIAKVLSVCTRASIGFLGLLLLLSWWLYA